MPRHMFHLVPRSLEGKAFIESDAHSILPRLAAPDLRQPGVQVASEHRRCAGLVSPLVPAPCAPGFEELGPLDTFARCHVAVIAEECADRA